MKDVPAKELRPFLKVKLLEMRLHREWSLKVFVAILALAQVSLKIQSQI